MKLFKQMLLLSTTVVMVATAPAQVMQKAPNFTATDANGTTHSLAQYKGQVVVLEFTNPGSPVTGHDGCPYILARLEHKTLQNLANKVKDQ